MDNNTIVKILTQYPDSVQNRTMLHGLLCDYFPKDFARINVLMIAFDAGIVEEIQNNELDSHLRGRLHQRLTGELSINEDMTQWAIETWFSCYGEAVLGKKALYHSSTILSRTLTEPQPIIEQNISSEKIVLTPQQKKAVHSEGKRIVVVAGPGSGKTRVITERICHLVSEKGIPAEHILALTFTSKAAGEMRKRIDSRLKNIPVNIRTFHSLGLQILRENADLVGRTANFEIVDNTKRNKIVRTILSEMQLPGNTIQQYTQYIGSVKNKTEDKVQSIKNGFLNDQDRVYVAYEKTLNAENLVDLDDMVRLAVKILTQNEDIRTLYRSQYTYILVDEYQDVNALQIQFLAQLICSNTAFFLVGDDDQCIYEWRGSKPSYLKQFANEITKNEVIYLEDNFRSEAKIVSLSDTFIRHNNDRINKKMSAMRSLPISKNAVPDSTVFYRFSSAKAEATFIAQQILNLSENFHYKRGDFAILLRGSNQKKEITDALELIGIQYYEQMPDECVYDDFMKVLYAINTPDNDSFLSSAVNYPSRLIDRIDMDDLRTQYNLDASMPVSSVFQYLNSSKKSFDRSDLFHKRYELIMRVHQLCSNSSAAEILNELLNYYQTDSDRTEKQIFYVERILQVAEEFDSAYKSTGNTSRFSAFLDYVQLSVQDEKGAERYDTAVNLMTCHKSKGLEFPVVFVPGVQVGIFPNDYFIQSNRQLEEERRLFYVTMTRAIERLYVTCFNDPLIGSHSNSIISKGFLAEIPNIIIHEKC